MAKNKEKRVSEEALEKETKAVKPQKNYYEKRKMVFKVVGWVMAISMLVGSLFAIFGLLAYYRG
jgi:preprotein translocase subunit Sec63